MFIVPCIHKCVETVVVGCVSSGWWHI